MLILSVFVFFTIIIKVILGVAVCYLLLPREAACAACDADTLTVTPKRGLGALYRTARIQVRWCVRCGRTTHARGLPDPLRLRLSRDPADRGELSPSA